MNNKPLPVAARAPLPQTVAEAPANSLPGRLAAMGVYARVVDAGGFSAAARQLGLTKSAVSKQVQRLEQALGVRLLNRTTRALSMTEAGRALYAHAAQCVSLAESAGDEIASLAAAPRGVLRVTASVAFGKQCLAPLLPEFLATYPELRLQLGLFDRFVDLADEGYDVAIRLTRSPPEAAVAKKLLPIDFVVCAAPAYLNGREIARPEDLAACNCFYYGHSENDDLWRFEPASLDAAAAVAVRVCGNVVVNSSVVLRDFLLAGMGVGLMPRYAVHDDLAAGRLVALLPQWQVGGSFRQYAYALWLPHRHLPPKIRVFVDFLVAKLAAGRP